MTSSSSPLLSTLLTLGEQHQQSMNSSSSWATTGCLVVATAAAAIWAYQSSDQKRIESALEKQNIHGQFSWSIPFLGHLEQFFHPDRLDLEYFNRPNIPDCEYLTLFGTPLLVLCDADLVTEFWNKAKSWAKHPLFYQVLDVMFGTKQRTMITEPRIENKVWHKKRDIVGQSFKKDNMDELAKYIESNTKQMCDEWCERGTGIDVDYELTNLTLRVIVYFIFGLKKSKQDITPIQEALMYMIDFAWSLNMNPFNGMKSMIPGTKAYQTSIDFRNCIKDLINEVSKAQHDDKNNETTTNEGQKRQHLIHALLAQKEWSQEVLENEVMSLLFAGHDTTAHATTIALDHCVQRPDVIDEVRKEYQQFQSEKKKNDDGNTTITSTMKELYSKMKWPTAIFKESLRLNPETPGGTIRVAPKDTPMKRPDGTQIIVPKGCAVLCPMWMYSRSKKNWGPDATEFNPNRFLSPPTGDVSSYRNFISFSQGKRNCVGMPLAYMEGSMLLGYILTQLDITVESPLKKVFSVTLRAENFVIGVKRHNNSDKSSNNTAQ